MKRIDRKRTGMFWRGFRQTAKENPRLFAVYFILRLSVVVIMVAQILNRQYANVLLCILTLFLFSIPSFIERQIKIDVPDTLEVIILLFIFAAEILGEIREYYVNVPGWDDILHVINGFLCSAIGIALIDILNRSKRLAFKMSPFFVALVAFCFSMTVGILWEFFEFTMDMVFSMDMQKDTILSSISSVALHPDGRNIAVIIENVTKTVITGVQNGVVTETTIDGYLDIGLIDTMKDLIVNFIGAAVFSVIGYFYIKYRGKGKTGRFASRFMLTKKSNSDKAADLKDLDNSDVTSSISNSDDHVAD